MSHKLLDLTLTQLARVCLLVKSVRAVPLEGSTRDWAILIEGRGFQRLLKEDLLVGPGLIRMAGWNAPRPTTFSSKAIAENYMRHVGLLPRQREWSVTNE